MLQVSPDVFHRIEFGRVSGEAAGDDPPVERIEVLADEAASMRRQPVPDDRQLSRNGALQMLKEHHKVFALDRTLEHVKVKVPQG